MAKPKNSIKSTQKSINQKIIFAMIITLGLILGIYLLIHFFIPLGEFIAGQALSPKNGQYHYPNEIKYDDKAGIGCSAEFGPPCTSEVDVYTNDPVNKVTSFYQTDLERKGWRVDTDNNNDSGQPGIVLRLTKKVFNTNYSIEIQYDPKNNTTPNEVILYISNDN